MTPLLFASAPGNAASLPVAQAVANYAFETASHDQPAQVVTAADVSNAVFTTSVNTTKLVLFLNLGSLAGYGRLVLLSDTTTFAWTCVNFPSKVKEPPALVACPGAALAAWQAEPYVLDESRNAVAEAASHGKAVSGADIVRAAASGGPDLAVRPTFGAGQGGKAKFVAKWTSGTTKTTSYLCVLFPRTEYGVPVQVAC